LASAGVVEVPIPTDGEISQAFVLLNQGLADRQEKNGGILGFFEFGTPDAKYPASPGWSRDTQTKDPRRPTMFVTETSNRLFAAAFSVVLSAAFFAYAIVPASPTLIA